MGRLWGGILAVAGIGLWYYGGTEGSVSLVNLGIGAIILGLVLAAMPSRGYVDRETLPMTCGSFCDFIGNMKEELDLEGSPVVVPPYENLPKGGIFLPKAKNFSLRLGKFGEGTVFITGTEEESGILVSPPPGWKIIEYTTENVGELSGTGIGYASSAVSSVLSALGIGSGEAFEREDGRIEVFVKPLCNGPFYADPVVSALLVGVAMGMSQVLKIESSERANDHVKLVLEPLGGVEKWL
ncbi:hypothetical protein A3L11_03550 [Thermococcus siculi]|uniref:Uncharacterized protein n=1 Tax=Thermococcus siculi TaxID=72803 RepID=A0A2Z2ML35_9EURY|nr:hypothetical protein [Thermococcus siculi]ASJ08355.1 hypothetical protein A3L11_03550 [Thermococcus siculi]